ncbi:3-deoxy-manno-octulosonate cytidylyltransferase [Hugenholtzia roseola]|uniref:3-deoxy-manno-octulosonate cytidylyltransferase n=1 Tax=Hugenholtzia roseola TaxID=1002 RepID=UPI000411E33C|nr:3-deoxy-manno-octulosonate cytidylyltransferase [Hugenholtzia roseola]
MNILGIIPARYASTRFPAKMLAQMGDKLLIERTFTQAQKAESLTSVWIATDDQRIFEPVQRFTSQVVLTQDTHPSGTDRCFEALQKIEAQTQIKFDFVINIQGDEPFIEPAQIDLLASLLQTDTQIATMATPIKDQADIFNPNVVKVVRKANGEALYFSRSPLPFVRDKSPNEWLEAATFLKHVGIYAYRSDILAQITALAPSSLEKSEALEQLRWLENGYRIAVGVSNYTSIGIDTPEDLEKVCPLFEK